MQITKELIESIHCALDKGLTKGVGEPIEGQMCVEALICHKLGLPHSDNPPCVGNEVRLAKISLNDCDWLSNQARAEGMRKLAIAQLGSNEIDQKIFKIELKLESTKRILPFLIQLHYDSLKNKDEELLEYKKKFENLDKLDDELHKRFYHYHYYHYHYHYYYYNDYHYYNYYYHYNCYYHIKDDQFLLLIADCILQVLIRLDSPGVKYLDFPHPK